MPNRGEVWLVDLGLAAKVRPCLIISTPAQLQDRALVTVITHTTALRSSQFEVPLKVPFLRAGAFVVQNVVTIPEAKLIRRLDLLTSQQMSEVEAVTRLWLGL
ncbi:MAG: type II toxin-antitoxin system PemK/MazF family toxin [Caldilinea sp. CFX5]|nr:type II toxin-antitoxin system PemK/MazF family toxin [Caldilinea sp. CFX5]